MTAPDWTPGGTRLARVLKTLLTDRKLAAGLEEVRTMGTADDRRFQVLRAIVADFVATKEPIGSKALVERHNLGVSSATVRNDMAVLEAEGYIAQPHTSSGRVPTEKGYREFVDRIHDVKPLSTPERRAILSFLESGVDLDDVLRRAVRLLAQLTRQVAVVQYPTLSASTVRHLEVVALTPARLLMVVITDSGRVDQRIVELGDTIDDHQVGQLRDLLSQALEGKRLSAASAAVADLASRLNTGSGQAGKLGDAVGRSATVLLESLVEHTEERLLLGGTANLTRNTADFGGSLRSVLEALEEQVVVLRLLAAQQDAGKVTVRIGHETEAEQMAGTSVVTTTYGSAGTVYGGMGVVGPTRMDYPGTMANVAAVARYIGEVLGNRAG
jgi:heat-inducible transcriptional repressor